MSKTEPIYDVFLSYGPQDAKSAVEVGRILQSFDLAVFNARAISRGKRMEEAIWDAMAESQALVVVVSQSEPSASTLFELGAAQGWNKPIFIVVADPASTRLPSFLHDLPVYPFSRLEEVARAIKNSSRLLTDLEKKLLIEEYNRMGESVDELLSQTPLLSKLTKQFKKRAKRQVAPEELLRTLLRLRKRGDLNGSGKRPRVKVSK
jgi:hypothetical protein